MQTLLEGGLLRAPGPGRGFETLIKPANQSSLGRILLIASILGVFLSGCTVVGPSAVRHGRLAYNAAINETNSQQMLMFVVQGDWRYASAERL